MPLLEQFYEPYFNRNLLAWFPADRSSACRWQNRVPRFKEAILLPNNTAQISRDVTKYGDAVAGTGTANTAYMNCNLVGAGQELNNASFSIAHWVFCPAATSKGVLSAFSVTVTSWGTYIGFGNTTVDNVGGNICLIFGSIRHIGTGASYGGIGIHHIGYSLGGGNTVRVYLDGVRVYQDSGTPPGFMSTALQLLGVNNNNRNWAGTVIDTKMWNKPFQDAEWYSMYREEFSHFAINPKGRLPSAAAVVGRSQGFIF